MIGLAYIKYPLLTEDEVKTLVVNNKWMQTIEAAVKGEIDPITGFVIDMKVLKDLIRTEIEDAFDHKNLNEEVPEFKTLNPTSENIVVVIWNKLHAKIDKKNKLSVTLYETPRNFVSYSGE